MPVLYGVFMFMGVSALRNMQVRVRSSLFLCHCLRLFSRSSIAFCSSSCPRNINLITRICGMCASAVFTYSPLSRSFPWLACSRWRVSSQLPSVSHYWYEWLSKTSHLFIAVHLGTGDMLRPQNHGQNLHSRGTLLAGRYLTGHETRSRPSFVGRSTRPNTEIRAQRLRWTNNRKWRLRVSYLGHRSHEPCEHCSFLSFSHLLTVLILKPIEMKQKRIYEVLKRLVVGVAWKSCCMREAAMTSFPNSYFIWTAVTLFVMHDALIFFSSL